jgi:hypothetical protein
MLQQSQQENKLGEGAGYHHRIWSTGAISPAGVEAAGIGPYLPIWQGRKVSNQLQMGHSPGSSRYAVSIEIFCLDLTMAHTVPTNIPTLFCSPVPALLEYNTTENRE